MAEKELKVRDFCGDYALDIPNFNDGTITLFFNSRRNAENVKRIIEVDRSVPNCATVCDMEEVRHAKWELIDECANEGVYCSNCHKKVYRAKYANQKLKSNYCPNCGAKMDKG